MMRIKPRRNTDSTNKTAKVLPGFMEADVYIYGRNRDSLKHLFQYEESIVDLIGPLH